MKFDFDSNKYGIITLGYTNNFNESSIELQLPEGFLPTSNNSYSPLFTQFTDRFTGTGSQNEFTVNYGLGGVSSWSDEYFIIYNEQELIDNFGSFSKGAPSGRPKLTFATAPPDQSKVNITYGIKSQYNLSYGFQKIDEPYSDSVRLIQNDDYSPTIKDELNNELSTYSLSDPSLYISLDDSSEKTILKLLNVPLLYDPEINLTFAFDEVILDLIDSFDTDFNNLTIQFKYITNDGYYEFYSDPIVIPLDYSEISPDIVDNTYYIYYNKDLQAIYDMVGADSLDIEIILHQVGDSENYIPFILLDEFEYLSDTHIVENFGNMPLDKYGNMNTKSLVNTPHYYQAFSHPFIDSIYGNSPFNLIEGSQVTVGLQNLPNCTLVSLDSDGENYAFDYLGDSSTLLVNDTNFYMIPNVGMFIDTYDIEETLYQDE